MVRSNLGTVAPLFPETYLPESNPLTVEKLSISSVYFRPVLVERLVRPTELVSVSVLQHVKCCLRVFNIFLEEVECH